MCTAFSVDLPTALREAPCGDFERLEAALSAAAAALDTRKAWSESVGSIDTIIRLFAAAASDARGVERVLARTSGPYVRLLVLTDGRDWTEVVDELEPKLRTLYVGGLASFEYDVVPAQGAHVGSGFQAVYIVQLTPRGSSSSLGECPGRP